MALHVNGLVMVTLVYLFVLLIQGYLLFNIIYVGVSAVAGRLSKGDDEPISNPVSRIRRIAVLIPAYKEDKVILDTIQANLKQTYPAQFYDLIVVADHFQRETLQQLRNYPIKVIAVAFEQSTVQRSLVYALTSLPRNDYDIVLICDADNHMTTDFLERINAAFDKGWRAVQGHRVAKNTNTPVAVFDAINEEINNSIFRSGQRALGMSASLIGSGMAFETEAMQRAMNMSYTVGGYDKELEMNLLVDRIGIAYLKDAFIYDEKVQNLAVFEQQRTRWIAAQLYFVKAYFRTALQEIRKGNVAAVNVFLKALLLPRTLFLAVLVLEIVLGLIVGSRIILLSAGWMLSLLIMSLLLSVPNYLWSKISYRDFIIFPLLIFRMVRSVTKFRIAGKKFLHTPHGETAVNK